MLEGELLGLEEVYRKNILNINLTKWLEDTILQYFTYVYMITIKTQLN